MIIPGSQSSYGMHYEAILKYWVLVYTKPVNIIPSPSSEFVSDHRNAFCKAFIICHGWVALHLLRE